jgi:hypothetical protein
MRATSSQSICVQCGTKSDIGLGFDSASHSTKENAPALTPTHEGTCAIQNPSSSANQVASQSIQEDVYHVEHKEEQILAFGCLPRFGCLTPNLTLCGGVSNSIQLCINFSGGYQCKTTRKLLIPTRNSSLQSKLNDTGVRFFSSLHSYISDHHQAC